MYNIVLLNDYFLKPGRYIRYLLKVADNPKAEYIRISCIFEKNKPTFPWSPSRLSYLSV